MLRRIGNWFVRGLLRSPLHPMMSGALVLITVRGRRTGREYRLPASYARDGDTLYILPGGAERKTWWRNLRGGAPVTVRLAGREREGRGEALDGADDTEAVAEGLGVYLRRFPRAASALGLPRGGAAGQDDLERAAARAVLVRVRL